MTDALTDPDELSAAHRHVAAAVARQFARRLPAGVTADDLEAACWVGIFTRARTAARSESLVVYSFRGLARQWAKWAAIDFINREHRRGFRGPAGTRPRVSNEPADGDDAPGIADLAAARPDAPEGWSLRTWRRALACLDDLARQVVLRHAVEGWNFAEIARATGTTVGAAKAEWDAAVVRIRAECPWLTEFVT